MVVGNCALLDVVLFLVAEYIQFYILMTIAYFVVAKSFKFACWIGSL